MRIGLSVMALAGAIVVTLDAQAPAPRKDAAAQVNGVVITNAELEESLAMPLSKLYEQIYAAKSAKLEALIDERLLAAEAKTRGMTVAALTEAEIDKQVAPVSDIDVAVFYGENKAKLQGDLAKWQDEIRKYLSAQRLVERRQGYLKSLRDRSEVKVFLEAPVPHRATVAIEGAPVRGAAAAPVTIVEFSDFHCPFCRKVQPVLEQLLSKYADKVKVVYKDFPLDSLHPQARAASEAARCARDQGKFWEYHDKIYAGSPDGSPATLKRIAQEVGIDAAAFDACVSARTHQAAVQQDVQQGATLGVTGTPGFFINGRFFSGAQPIEVFTRVIEEELARSGK